MLLQAKGAYICSALLYVNVYSEDEEFVKGPNSRLEFCKLS